MRTPVFVTALLSMTFGLTADVNACVVPIERNYNRILGAHGIFVGEMVAYKPIGFNDRGNASQALVTYRVDEVLKGQIADQIEVYFPPINYRVPDSRKSRGPEIVSFWRLQYKDKDKNPLESNKVISGPCEGIYVLEGRAQNVLAVKGWIADGIARPSELYSEEAENAARVRSKREKRIAERRAARGLPPIERLAEGSDVESPANTPEEHMPWYAYVLLILLGIAAVVAASLLWKLTDPKNYKQASR